MRQQVGALPIRWTGDEPRVLLVTSRETQRWIIPKGWRMRGRSNAEAAAQEALEEAGVRGRVHTKPIGRYKYAKRLADGVEDCKVTTYLLEVTEELDAFPEMAERQREWFTVADAVACADDEGLRAILQEIGPRLDTLRPVVRKAAKKRGKAAGGAAAETPPDSTTGAADPVVDGPIGGGRPPKGAGRKAGGQKSAARKAARKGKAKAGDAGDLSAVQLAAE